MAAVSWLPEAIQDTERLHDFLYSKNPQAASTAAGIILRAVDLLAKNPRLGRPMSDEAGTRELFTAYGVGAYVVRYRIVDENPVVIRVWHSRENRNDAS